MAINVTEILGTDSLSGSRLVINDNFNILTSRINAMEVYFYPPAGVITNLNDLKTESLRVGLNTVLLDINASKFDILSDIKVNGDINIEGGNLIRNNINPQTIDDVFVGPSLNIKIGTSTAVPPYTVERVGNNNTSPLSIEVHDGTAGQELFFVYSESSTGAVDISGFNDTLILPGSIPGTLRLDGQGQTAHIMCVSDGSGNVNWYLIGGSNYTII